MQIEERHRNAAGSILGFLRSIDWSCSSESWKSDKIAQIIADCEASSDPLAVAARMERAEMDKELESVIALSAERDGWNAEKLGHADSITKWSSAERLCQELAVGLNSLLADQTVHLHFTALSGLAVGTCVCCRCNALALLSRPEVVKMLEEREAGRG